MHHSGVHMSKGTSAFFCVVINKGTCLTEHSVENPTLRRKTLKYGDVKCFLFCWKRCLPCADLFAWSCFILFLISCLLKVALLFTVGENYNGLLHIYFLSQFNFNPYSYSFIACSWNVRFCSTVNFRVSSKWFVHH